MRQILVDHARSHQASVNSDRSIRPMLGLKTFATAKVVIGGIELTEKIKKGRFKMGKLGGATATMPEIWQAALAG